jgi:hypothetical protein
MKRFMSAVLSTLVISVASSSAVRAQSETVDSSALNPGFNPGVTSNPSSQITPFDLAFLAYRGYLQAEGIPSGQLLVTQIQVGNVSAETVVQAAIKAHRLSEQMLTDQGYLHALEGQLNAFSED